MQTHGDKFVSKQSIMKTNMGTLDRAIRIGIALVIAGLYYANIINGTIATILIIVAGAFILTSFIGFCPLYYPFRISTYRKKSAKV
jgi:hypothetical protein